MEKQRGITGPDSFNGQARKIRQDRAFLDQSDGVLEAIPKPEAGFSIEEYVSNVRKGSMKRALEMSDGNQSEAARLLGISPQAVHKFLKTEKK